MKKVLLNLDNEHPSKTVLRNEVGDTFTFTGGNKEEFDSFIVGATELEIEPETPDMAEDGESTLQDSHIVILEDKVYKASKKTYKKITDKQKQVKGKGYYLGVEVDMYDFLETVKPELEYIGPVMFDFRL